MTNPRYAPGGFSCEGCLLESEARGLTPEVQQTTFGHSPPKPNRKGNGTKRERNFSQCSCTRKAGGPVSLARPSRGEESLEIIDRRMKAGVGGLPSWRPFTAAKAGDLRPSCLWIGQVELVPDKKLAVSWRVASAPHRMLIRSDLVPGVQGDREPRRRMQSGGRDSKALINPQK